ncbi:hypothetical protein DAPPUDRAFT_232963 [Daphnia pulex]|uniref:Uncharacterized protein n=1 Tax=Daphnia pulex TaxID=6669 RepID=E9FSU1_DAPPU|nr:hypothetical protein DAPPUDRAFT_232963 [Daphnia pulex]|eukprot:EFX89255.1 hypothetical protein DAPPUDRAFT_232963 [Daphnia pulex]
MSAIVSCTSHLVKKHFGASKEFMLNRMLPFHRLDPLTVRYKLLVSIIAQKLILLNQQTREFIAPSRSCVVCVDHLHHARDNQDQHRLDQEEEKNGEAKNDDTHSNPQQRKPAEGKAHPSPATTTFKRKGTPIPRNFNLQKERAVRLSFTFEGHGDHYIKRAMQWCRGWVRTGRVSSFPSSYNSRNA